MPQIGLSQQRSATIDVSGLHGRTSGHIGGRINGRKLAFAVPATLLVALCAHVAIPLGFTPVPISMAPFAVLLLGLLFDPVSAFACLSLYLLEGAAGLPVFSPHGPGGIAQLLGPTGGYLLSYPFAATLASFLYSRGPRRFPIALGSAALASLLILAGGAAWLEVLTRSSLPTLFFHSIAPFLPGDILKVFAAAACATALGSFHQNRRETAL